MRVALILAGMLCGIGFMARADDFSLAGIEKLIIEGQSAQVVLNSGPSILVSKTSGWSARNEGTVLRVQSVSNSPGRFEISVPPTLKVELHLREGNVLIQKAQATVLVDLLKGKVQIKDSRGSARVSLQEGSLIAIDFQGNLDFDLYKGSLSLVKVNGEVSTAVFQGDLVAEDVQGTLSMLQNLGNFKISNSSGNLKFKVSKATSMISQFRGHIEVENGDAAVQIKVAGEPDLQIQNNSGRVVVDGAGVGALFQATSEDGEISGPPQYKVTEERGRKALRFRGKGSATGHVDVNSQKGVVVLKE